MKGGIAFGIDFKHLFKDCFGFFPFFRFDIDFCRFYGTVHKKERKRWIPRVRAGAVAGTRTSGATGVNGQRDVSMGLGVSVPRA